MVWITIRLVGEDIDSLFKPIEVDRQIEIVEFKKKIETLTNIPSNYQQIKFRGDWVFISADLLESINDFEELVVTHFHLDYWNVYKESVELVLKKRRGNVETAKQAVQRHELLTKTGFFDVYPQFNNFQKEKHSEVAFWADDDVTILRKATERYFQKLDDQKRGDEDSEFICYFENRDVELGGRPMGSIAFVKIHGEESVTKYNVKCLHYEGTYSGRVPDVIELFCYKLFSLIGVGPKSIHIIPLIIPTGNKTNTFIATQWDDNFENLETLIDENILCADVFVQLNLLKRLLSIFYLIEQNCGRWKGTKNAAIVDFAMLDRWHINKSIIYDLQARWKRDDFYVRNQFDDNSLLKIAKMYLDKWDLSRNIELAREQIDPTGDLFRSIEIGLKKEELENWGPTSCLNDYIDILYKNLEILHNSLNSIVE